MNFAKKLSWAFFLKFFVAFLFLTPSKQGVSRQVATVPVVCTCSAPNATVSTQLSDSVSFSWNAVSGATAYKVWYRRQGDNYTSSEITTGNLSITFSNLPPGTYDFYFSTICVGESSDYMVIDDLLMG